MRILLFVTGLASVLWTGSARAHMPLLRELSVAEGGERLLARMPGFGFVLQRAGGEPVYMCDALLGVSPGEMAVPWAMLGSGDALLGTARGLRHIDSNGCPDGDFNSDLEELPVVALALQRASVDLPERVYAVAGESELSLYASSDGGQRFELLSVLPSGRAVTGLAVAPHPGRALYVSQAHSPTSTALSWSTDGGASLTMGVLAGEVMPLHVFPETGGLLARLTDVGVRKVAIVRGEAPGGDLQSVLTLNFFGGLAVQASGEVWVGDEGGGVYRSEDGGETFALAFERSATACLIPEADGLWACTPGLPEQPAIARLQKDAVSSPWLALSDVRNLVRCEDAQEVAQVCAEAWQEWQVDVLLAAGVIAPPPATGDRDAGVDVGLDVGLDAGPVVAGDAGAPIDADAGFATAEKPTEGEPGGTAGVSSACAVSTVGASLDFSTGYGGLALLLAFFVFTGRPRRRDSLGCSAMTQAPPGDDRANPAAPPSDGVLMARAQRGDADAFIALYDRHAPIALAVARRMLRDGSLAEDLLQDVFIEAWRSVRTYDAQRANVRTWLLVRVRSRALDRLGRRLRETHAVEGLGHGVDVTPHGQMERGLSVRQALDELDAGVRDTLELTYFAGLTAPELAQHMGVPGGTVRSRLARGLRQLAESLRGKETDDGQ